MLHFHKVLSPVGNLQLHPAPEVNEDRDHQLTKTSLYLLVPPFKHTRSTMIFQGKQKGRMLSFENHKKRCLLPQTVVFYSLQSGFYAQLLTLSNQNNIPGCELVVVAIHVPVTFLEYFCFKIGFWGLS